MTKGVWKYYFPEQGDGLEEAQTIPTLYKWQSIRSAEEAAEFAAEHEWSGGGHDNGMSHVPTITVVSPEGEETVFLVYRETEVVHYPVEKQNEK